MPRPRLSASLRRLEQSSGALATQSVSRMDEKLSWFRSLPADQRSWVMLVAQAGIAAFAAWLHRPDASPEITDEVFGAAPPELARVLSLQRTVALVRVVIEVVEEQVPRLAARGEEAELHEAVLLYSREVAFAAARVYATAAETRGAWDARLQALLIDALVRDDPADLLVSRAAALGWAEVTPVAVVVARPPAGNNEAVTDALHRAGRHAGAEVLAGVQADRLVVVIGRSKDPLKTMRRLLPEVGEGPVVVGPPGPDIASAGASARAALSGARAAAGWPTAPRPVAAGDLLPERALCGDAESVAELIEVAYAPLAESGITLLDTLSAYLETGGTLEGTARLLFVHPNTVRYRLRRVTDVCGLSPMVPRDRYTLQIALTLGHLHTAAP